MTGLSIFGVPGLPEIEHGADLATMIADASTAAGTPIENHDVVGVTSKIVSKAEGQTVDLIDHRRLTLRAPVPLKSGTRSRRSRAGSREAKRVVRGIGPVLITETHHGFVCANSGVDQSSSGAHGRAVLLPVDPDGSARRLRARFAELGADVAVIISDTFGRPWREAQTDIAIGLAGMNPVVSYIGQVDPHGHEFRVQVVCAADELAGAAELVKGNVSRVPVGVIRGFQWEADEQATMKSVLRDSANDLFR